MGRQRFLSVQQVNAIQHILCQRWHIKHPCLVKVTKNVALLYERRAIVARHLCDKTASLIHSLLIKKNG
jgi:hypothetical protein